jgi:hypothetical protein
MNGPLKSVFAAAALVVIVVVGINVLGSGRAGRSIAAASTPATSPSPAALSSPVISASPAASSTPSGDRMTVAGTELTSALYATVKLPAGWQIDTYGTERRTTAPPEGMGMVLSLVDNTFKDPCAHIERSPKIGPTVADVATALGQIPGTTATNPSQTTIAGHAATSVELTIPATLPCPADEFYLWQDSPHGFWWVQGVNERVHVWILEVGGRRVSIATHSYPTATPQEQAELQGILDSLTFDAGS